MGRNPRPLQQARSGFQAEVRVLEVTQERKVNGDRHDEEPAPGARILAPSQTESGEKTDDRREEHQAAELVIPEGIKDVTGDRQPDIALLLGPEQPEDKIRNRQEGIEKSHAVEEHPTAPEIACVR